MFYPQAIYFCNNGKKAGYMRLSATFILRQPQFSAEIPLALALQSLYLRITREPNLRFVLDLLANCVFLCLRALFSKSTSLKAHVYFAYFGRL